MPRGNKEILLLRLKLDEELTKLDRDQRLRMNLSFVQRQSKIPRWIVSLFFSFFFFSNRSFVGLTERERERERKGKNKTRTRWGKKIKKKGKKKFAYLEPQDLEIARPMMY